MLILMLKKKKERKKKFMFSAKWVLIKEYVQYEFVLEGIKQYTK